MKWSFIGDFSGNTAREIQSRAIPKVKGQTLGFGPWPWGIEPGGNENLYWLEHFRHGSFLTPGLVSDRDKNFLLLPDKCTSPDLSGVRELALI